jgi:hypothetical protein
VVAVIARCPATYERDAGREPGDRIVECHLQAGHPGEHEEDGTDVTWINDDDLWMPEDFEPCGAEFPLRPGQGLCLKAKNHHLGPDTDWKRHEHSNGLLKWRVDGADMPGDIPTAAASRTILRAFDLTGSNRQAFVERMGADPVGFADELAAQVVEAVRHADRVMGGGR